MIYAVVPLSGENAPNNLQIQEKVVAIDHAAYTLYAPRIYFVRYKGSAGDLAKQIGFAPPENNEKVREGIVLRIHRFEYSGLALGNLWPMLEEE